MRKRCLLVGVAIALLAVVACSPESIYANETEPESVLALPAGMKAGDAGAMYTTAEERYVAIAMSNETKGTVAQVAESDLPALAEAVLSVAASDPEHFMVDCGIRSCSWYFTAEATRFIADHGYIPIAAFGMVGFTGSLAGRIFAAWTGVAVAKAAQAAPKGNCLRVRWAFYGPWVPAFYDVTHAHFYCRDSWRTVNR